MMIRINGEEIEIAGGISIAELLRLRNIGSKNAVVEYNGSILRPEEWKNVILKDGDVLEVVSFVGGG